MSQSGRPFENWARTVRTAPVRWAAPSTESEVVALVRAARAAGERLKVHGARHSWSAIAAPDHLAVTLAGLDRLVAVDPEAGTITVEAGISLQALADALAPLGLALPILGSIAEQSIAGATATGTHGSAVTIGNLGTLIQGARLVDGTGEVRDIGPDDDVLHAVRVHLGALGILTQVTLKVVPLFQLRETRQRVPFEVALDTMLDVVQEHDFAKYWWLPHTPDPLLFAYDRTEEPGDPSALAVRLDRFVNDTVFRGLLALGKPFPRVIPWVMGTVGKTYTTDRERIGRYDRMLTLVMPPRHRETELAFPHDAAPESLRFLRDWVVQRDARLDFIQELRFVAQDASWMSPAHSRPTCQFGVYGTVSPELDDAMAAFHRWGEGHDARPHWGKEFGWDGFDVDAHYPKAQAFRELATTWDPDGVFRNAFLDQVLGTP